MNGDVPPIQGDCPPIRCGDVVRRLLCRVVTKHQLLVLNELERNGQYIAVTNLVQKLSEEKNIPASTLRHNIKSLVEDGLLVCGDAHNKGVPVDLTEGGRMVLKIMGRGDKDD